jgi:arsenate reductase
VKTVLFLCTGSAARSQMAEGLVNARFGDRWHAASAGVAPKGLDPKAVQAMAETGDAAAHCPAWPGAARKTHLPFDDPGRIRAEGGDVEVLAVMRRVRDQMLWQLPEALRQFERTVTR